MKMNLFWRCSMNACFSGAELLEQGFRAGFPAAAQRRLLDEPADFGQRSMRVMVTSFMRVTMCVVVVAMMIVLVPVSVPMSMNVIVSMTVYMLVRLDGHGLLADDAELRRANAGADHLFSPD